MPFGSQGLLVLTGTQGHYRAGPRLLQLRPENSP